MLSLSAKGIDQYTPTKVAPVVDFVKNNVFGFGFVNDLYTKIDDLSKPVADSITTKATEAQNKYDKLKVTFPKTLKDYQTKIDVYIPPLDGKARKPVTTKAVPAEMWEYTKALFVRSKTYTVDAVTAAPTNAIAYGKAKYTELSNCSCAKNAYKQAETAATRLQSDYVVPGKKIVTEFGTPYYKSAVESEYYANAKKQYQYYNKAALPYYQNMVTKSQELLKVWPVSVFVEYVALAKATITKHLPVQWCGATGGATAA